LSRVDTSLLEKPKTDIGGLLSRSGLGQILSQLDNQQGGIGQALSSGGGNAIGTLLKIASANKIALLSRLLEGRRQQAIQSQIPFAQGMMSPINFNILNPFGQVGAMRAPQLPPLGGTPQEAPLPELQGPRAVPQGEVRLETPLPQALPELQGPIVTPQGEVRLETPIPQQDSGVVFSEGGEITPKTVDEAIKNVNKDINPDSFTPPSELWEKEFPAEDKIVRRGNSLGIQGLNSREEQIEFVNLSDKKKVFLGEVDKIHNRRMKARRKKDLAQPQEGGEIAKEPFFTKTEKAIKGLKQNTLTSQQAKAQIVKFGKKADIEEGKLDSFLASKGKFTKQELLDFVKENKNTFEVSILGNDPKLVEATPKISKLHTIVTNRTGRQDIDNIVTKAINLELSEQEEDELLGEQGKQLLDDIIETQAGTAEQLRARGFTGKPTKWQQYQLPGGENYQELKFKVPVKEEISEEQILEDEKIRLKELMERFKDKGEIHKKIFKAQLDLLEKEGVGGLTREQIEHFRNQQQFKSHAFDEPNVFSWLRVNDRTSSEGDKVLFVEEMQKINSNVDDVTDEQLKSLPKFATNNNTEFMVKQMVKKAIDDGKDVVAWTSGEQQADRFDLSKQVDRMEWVTQSTTRNKILNIFREKADIEPMLKLSIDSDGKIVNTLRASGMNPADITGKNLSNVIGKETASKITGDDRISGTLFEKDLKVGGEALKQTYDVSLPRVADKYIKTLDKDAKVEEINLGAEIQETKIEGGPEKGKRVWRVIDTDGIATIYSTKEKAIQNAPKLNQKGFRITPAMKNKVLKEGQPLSSLDEDRSLRSV